MAARSSGANLMPTPAEPLERAAARALVPWTTSQIALLKALWSKPLDDVSLDDIAAAVGHSPGATFTQARRSGCRRRPRRRGRGTERKENLYGVTMDPEFLDGLAEIARTRGTELFDLIEEV